MVLFLAADGDILILNKSIGFERDFMEFFDTMSYAANRLLGSNLFKGKLEFCLRDIAEHSNEEET